ncbi:MAG TPA: hypothetical protein GXZ28_04790 [Clostridiales bacterium]|nr:hypothetical protein [Clostridiales bacterium]
MKNNKGTTLIELVIVVGIITTIIAVIAAFYISGVKGFAREASTADNQFKVRRSSNDIGREIRRASNITINSGKLELEYTDGTKKVYRLEDQIIKVDLYIKDAMGGYSYNDTSELVKGIKTFDISMNTEQITMKIESLENTEGFTYQLVSEISIRK